MPLNVAKRATKTFLDEFIKANVNMFVKYDPILKIAKKQHSKSHHVARIFVLGNQGVGKSSFVEILMREEIHVSLWKVFESAVTPHTIIPSKSQQCGKML